MECKKEGMMMMFVRMGGGAMGYHKKLREVGKGGQNIMKKKVPQNAFQSTYILKIGGKILKWWGGGCLRGGVHYV